MTKRTKYQELDWDCFDAMKIEEQIKSGCKRLIRESAQTSEGEPNLAIAQLLLAAATLGMTVEMDPKQFEYGVGLAMSETFYRPKKAA